MTLSSDEPVENPDLSIENAIPTQSKKTGVRNSNKVSSNIQYLFFALIIVVVGILVPYTIECYKTI